MRVRNRIAWIVLSLLLLVVGVLGVTCRSYLRSLAWHIRNGQYERFGAYRLKLPMAWWEYGRTWYESPSLLRSHGAHTTGQINILWIPAERVPREGTDLPKEEDLLISRFSRDGKAPLMSKYVIKTKSRDLYCIRDGTPPNFSSIRCKGYGLQYMITYTGDYTTEREAEEIFSTLELSTSTTP
jgi:hypothetical protein